MNEADRFMTALENNDIDELRTIPKSDLHNHFFLGGNRNYIKQRTNIEVPILKDRLKSMEDMHKWVGENIGNVFEGKSGRLLALEACFEQAKKDGVSILEIGDDVWANGYFYGSNIGKLIEAFTSTHKKIAPEIELRLQIGLSRHCSIKDLEEWCKPFFECDCFYSIDLYGDELAQPIKNFKGIYKKAKDKGLILKAHVGEWGDAESVREAVEELELDEVQHGISASKSTKVMNWLSDHGIQLNICPTSNFMLSRVESIKKHPIKDLFENGVKVTINSDDILVFNKSVSEEFLMLYNESLFNAKELNTIRMNGLT